MKIGISGLELEGGKVKYEDPRLDQLVEKCKPKKVAPYYLEFVEDEFVNVDAIVVSAEKLLDILIMDMEKLETRLERSEDESEKALLKRCLENLENEVPFCDMEFDDLESETIVAIQPVTLKPIVSLPEEPEVKEIIEKVFEKSELIFFYTAGEKEVHAWDIKKGSEIIACAGKIHSDLERGFIKGDVMSFEDFMASHNFNEGKKNGLVKVVDKDYVINPNEVIEIRFNV